MSLPIWLSSLQFVGILILLQLMWVTQRKQVRLNLAGEGLFRHWR